MSKRGESRSRDWLLARVNYDGADCLMWPFSAGPGYGQFQCEQKRYYAHRFMCELVNGAPPTPFHQATHSCRNGRQGCVHPKHLSWKTNGQNQLDRRKHGTNHTKFAQAKLTAEQVAQIRELVKTKTLMQIAAMFGVTHSTIQYRLYGGSHKKQREKFSGRVT